MVAFLKKRKDAWKRQLDLTPEILECAKALNAKQFQFAHFPAVFEWTAAAMTIFMCITVE